MADERDEISDASAAEKPPQSVDLTSDPDHELPSTTFTGEDFLFHLYRGSELLQDNCVEEAKEELERALGFQPRDVEGQGLLGIVYFRLGLYPRAIQIYRDIVEARPNELTPFINLALCYLKTGQLGDARIALEAVIRQAPDHKRAWGYLGLVFERMGDYAKARASFERAAQPHMVRRMDNILGQEQPRRDTEPPERAELRRAAADAVEEIDTMDDPPGAFIAADEGPAEAPPSRSGRWRAMEPGDASIPPLAARSWAPPASAWGERGATPSFEGMSVPPPSLLAPRPALSSNLLTQATLLPVPNPGAVLQTTDGWVVVDLADGLSVRQNVVVALRPRRTFKGTPVKRRRRGREIEDLMGHGEGLFVCVEGDGQLVLGAPVPLECVELEDGFLYLREKRLVAFSGTVRHENGRLAAATGPDVPMVQLSGRGPVIFERPLDLRAYEVDPEHPATLRVEWVLGWTGRLLAQPASAQDAPGMTESFVTFNGEGTVLISKGEDP